MPRRVEARLFICRRRIIVTKSAREGNPPAHILRSAKLSEFLKSSFGGLLKSIPSQETYGSVHCAVLRTLRPYVETSHGQRGVKRNEQELPGAAITAMDRHDGDPPWTLIRLAIAPVRSIYCRSILQ